MIPDGTLITLLVERIDGHAGKGEGWLVKSVLTGEFGTLTEIFQSREVLLDRLAELLEDRE